MSVPPIEVPTGPVAVDSPNTESRLNTPSFLPGGLAQTIRPWSSRFLSEPLMRIGSFAMPLSFGMDSD